MKLSTFTLTYKRYRRFYCFLISALFSVISLNTNAQLAGWDASPLSAYGPSPFTATTTAANITVGGITRGAGVTTVPTAAARAWGGTGWDNLTSAANITSNDYFTFTIKANTGYTLSLSAINPFDYRRSGTGPNALLFQYQLNAGSFQDITTAALSGGGSPSSSGYSLGSTDLSGIAGLQNLPATTTVTFRIVPYGATSSSGTFYIFDKANTTANDFAVTGTATCVPTTYYVDLDADTYGSASDPGTASCSAILGSVTNNTDCNDGNSAIKPGATEICNGIDDNCSGAADEGLTFLNYYTDADADGYGSTGATPVSSCSAIAGKVTNNTDCNDGSSAINPGATEICNGIDDNCSGAADEGLTFITYYVDADGDTYGSSSDPGVSSCTPISGKVTDNTDCNDGSSAINPGATEICNGIDDNCSGASDEGLTFTTYYADADGDTYGDAGTSTNTCSGAPSGYVADNTDCNDGSSAINPGATEICNGIDDNCSGAADEGLTFTTYYADADGDTYGDAGTSTNTCSGAPSGYVTDNTDCNDADISVHTPQLYYVDADGDTYGSATTAMLCSSTAPSGYSTNNTDCNDGSSAINPGATEICNGIDDNCSGASDEGLTFTTYYADADGDTYGDAGTSTSTCSGAPSGYVTDNTDCNDADISVHTPQLYYVDADGDTYGSATTAMLCSSTAPSGYSTNNTDCNDGNSAINPGATEICNGIDDNCSGAADEGLTFITYYADADGDTYGDAGTSTSTCSGAPSGYVTDNTDCNDGNSAINPGATEICNGIDDNCSGVTDEGCTTYTYYADTDGDGYGNILAVITTYTPTAPSGYVTNSNDCDDTNASIKPGATEVCNGIDDNCNGNIDENVVTASIGAGGSTTFCKGSSVTLTATTGAGYIYSWFRNGNHIGGASSSTYVATKKGDYVCQITVPGGCFATSNTISIFTSPTPAASISAPQGTDLCGHLSLKLKANSGAGGGLTYQWYKNGAIISGATAAMYTATTIGNYKVLITNAQGCSKFSATIAITTSCHLDGNAKETSITLYPNPTMNEFTIGVTVSEDITKDAVISIYNIVGELIYTQSAQMANGVLNERVTLQNDIPGGLYLVKVSTDHEEYVQQLVIEK